jgi:hypothetical protein
MIKSATPIHSVDLQEWLENAINEPNSRYGAFIYDDLPSLRNPPVSWVCIVKALIDNRWKDIPADILFACTRFLVQQDVDGTIKQDAVSILLQRAPSIESVLMALDVWKSLDAPEQSMLSDSIVNAYKRLTLWRRMVLNCDGRFRAIARNG